MNDYIRAAATGTVLAFFLIGAYNILRHDWWQVIAAAACMVGFDLVRRTAP